MLIKMSREEAKVAKGEEGEESLALVSFAVFVSVAGLNAFSFQVTRSSVLGIKAECPAKGRRLRRGRKERSH